MAQPGRTVTIAEVAAEAGVSISTVSNVLNGRIDRMRPSTLQRVERAIDTFQYRPSLAARQLRTGRAQVLGLVVPSVANPFWGSWARAVEAAALRRGYRVLLCNSERNRRRESAYITELWAEGVRDVILGSSLPSLKHLAGLIERGLRLITFDRQAQPRDPPSVASVSVDNVFGAELATRHLIELGHRRLALISGPLRTVSRVERLTGCYKALDDAGLPRDTLIVCEGQEKGSFGDAHVGEMARSAALNVLSAPDPPTGLFAVNDMGAIGICSAARELGLHVPSDVSVVGFDDIELARLYTPPLTTVRQPLDAMARFALDLIHEAKHASFGHHQSKLIKPELVVRESTARSRR